MNKIIWERWHDPIRPMVMGRKVKPCEQEEDGHDPDLARARLSFDDDGDEGPNPYDDGDGRGNAGPCVLGPFGVIPMLESNLPSKLFNFWMGHTNFGLTEGLAEAVEAVPGVESIDVITPYRFRISVGRAFEQRAVMSDIERAVQPPPPPPAPAKAGPLEELRRMMSRTYPFWAIAVDGRGNHHAVGGETRDEVVGKLGRFGYGGAARLIKSWEGQ